MDCINTWWKDMGSERFWLGVPHPERGGELLATPCGSARGTDAGGRTLIRHVREGDAVFHFDRDKQAIVAWSTSRGEVQKRQLTWSRWEQGSGAGYRAPELLLCWTIELEPPIALESPVSLGQIARLQSDMFLALRALEDTVGDPLYYPFELGNSVQTRLPAGHVFKLPGLFVEACPALARAAGERAGLAHAREREPGHPGARESQLQGAR